MNKYAKWILIAFAIFALLFAAGCAKKTFQESTTSAGVAQGRANIGYAAPMMMAKEEMAGDSMEAYSTSPSIEYDTENKQYGSREDITIETKIIRNGNLNIEVDDYFLASQKAEAYAKKYGGYVSNSDARVDSDEKHSGTVTIRVPENNFDAVIAELTLLGEIESKNINGQDVTEEYMDLVARINNSKAHEARLVEMFDDAKNVNEMLQVENQLSRVRSEIESMQGRLRYLTNRVDMSTVTVYLHEQVPTVTEWGVWQSFKNAVNNFLSTLRWLIELIGFLLPLIVFGTAVWLVIRWRIRKHRVELKKK